MTTKPSPQYVATRKAPKPQTELQKVCLQYGKDCWALGNSFTLARFLRSNGEPKLADAVEEAMYRAKGIAKQRYFEGRKAIQPDWEDWTARSKRIFEEDTRAFNIWRGDQP